MASAAEGFMWGLWEQRMGMEIERSRRKLLGEGGALESALIILDISFVIYFLLVLVILMMCC